MKTPVDKADNYSFRSGTRTLSNSYNNIFLADPWESIKEHDYQSEHAKKIVRILMNKKDVNPFTSGKEDDDVNKLLILIVLLCCEGFDQKLIEHFSEVAFLCTDINTNTLTLMHELHHLEIIRPKITSLNDVIDNTSDDELIETLCSQDLEEERSNASSKIIAKFAREFINQKEMDSFIPNEPFGRLLTLTMVYNDFLASILRQGFVNIESLRFLVVLFNEKKIDSSTLQIVGEYINKTIVKDRLDSNSDYKKLIENRRAIMIAHNENRSRDKTRANLLRRLETVDKFLYTKSFIDEGVTYADCNKQEVFDIPLDDVVIDIEKDFLVYLNAQDAHIAEALEKIFSVNSNIKGNNRTAQILNGIKSYINDELDSSVEDSIVLLKTFHVHSTIWMCMDLLYAIKIDYPEANWNHLSVYTLMATLIEDSQIGQQTYNKILEFIDETSQKRCIKGNANDYLIDLSTRIKAYRSIKDDSEAYISSYTYHNSEKFGSCKNNDNSWSDASLLCESNTSSGVEQERKSRVSSIAAINNTIVKVASVAVFSAITTLQQFAIQCCLQSYIALKAIMAVYLIRNTHSGAKDENIGAWKAFFRNNFWLWESLEATTLNILFVAALQYNMVQQKIALIYTILSANICTWIFSHTMLIKVDKKSNNSVQSSEISRTRQASSNASSDESVGSGCYRFGGISRVYEKLVNSFN